MHGDADLLATPERAGIRKLYEGRGIEPQGAPADFGCPHLLGCAGSLHASPVVFLTGTWPYVGTRYGEARVHSAAARILFVAMERGGAYNPTDEPEFVDTQASFRSSTAEPANPHMGGVSQLVQALVDTEQSDMRSSLFALTNAVKCVWGTGNQNSTSSPTMKQNCAAHLQAEIEFLQPHLLVTQGVHPRDTVCGLYPALSHVADYSGYNVPQNLDRPLR